MVIEDDLSRGRVQRVLPTRVAARRRGREALAMTLTLGVGLLLTGCSSGDDRPTTYPVSGQVRVGGEPAAGAFVVFHPVGPVDERAGRPTAQVRPDGSFELTTFDEADGAPAGDYAVTIEWRKLIEQGGEVQAGPNIVPDQYARSDSTPLKIKVAEDTNSLTPFEIERRR